MKYDFSYLNKESSKELYHEYMDKYVACVYLSDEEKLEQIYSYYKNIIKCFTTSCEESEILQWYKKLAIIKIDLNIPYIVITNEIYSLKNMLIKKGLQNKDLAALLDIFYKINNLVAKIYLDVYVQNLISANNIRLSSLSDVLELNIIKFYKYHLEWLNKLAQNIQNYNDKDFPQLDAHICEFGIWLQNEAKMIIRNNSKYQSLENLHNRLHLMAKKIRSILQSNDYHVLISYLEKCELISLNIGTELVLVDNIEINKKVTKDSLTGALNRHALRSIFETQYELAFATESSFVLAICDLDNFKFINDTYGHISGDRILSLFVKTIKNNIRNSDVVIRYGGEEFIIMLPAIDHFRCKEILQKICLNFEKAYIENKDQKISTTVSIGAIEIKPQLPFISTLVDDYIMIADKKLYMAKNRGKNRVEC